MKRLGPMLWAALLCACTPSATPIPITLTAAVPVPAATPSDLTPPMNVGSRFIYTDGTALVAVPQGPFVMGHGSADNPEHTLTLSDYWIYATEVTNRQYSICERLGRCTAPAPADNPDYSEFHAQNWPVVGVTHDQALAYCNYLNADLPTEAQWEKAARGSASNPFPWGKNSPSCDLLNFGNCQDGPVDVFGYPKGASPYSALHMSGNVYEWVGDWYDPLYYENSPSGDPPGPDVGRTRVIRSSGYRSNETQSLTYARAYASPADHRRDLGFRCAVQDLSYFASACRLTPSVSVADMASVIIDCPRISIEIQTTACRYGGGAVVTFNNDHPQDPNASFGGIVGCQLLSGKPGSFPLSYQCKNTSKAVLSSSCTYSGITNLQCPTHYSLNATAGFCEWDGTRTVGTECPGGDFFDPAQNCCLSASGSNLDNSVCPVGTVFTEINTDVYACLPSETVRRAPSDSRSIDPPVCANLCELTTELCAVRNLIFCPTTCACLSVGVKCP